MPGCLGLNIVIASLGPDTNFLELLLAYLRALLVLVRIVEPHLAMIENAANRRTLVRGDLNQVQIGFTSFFQGLGSGNYAQLLSIDANEANGTDTDLLVDARPAVRRWLTVE